MIDGYYCDCVPVKAYRVFFCSP